MSSSRTHKIPLDIAGRTARAIHGKAARKVNDMRIGHAAGQVEEEGLTGTYSIGKKEAGIQGDANIHVRPTCAKITVPYGPVLQCPVTFVTPVTGEHELKVTIVSACAVPAPTHEKTQCQHGNDASFYSHLLVKFPDLLVGDSNSGTPVAKTHFS